MTLRNSKFLSQDVLDNTILEKLKSYTESLNLKSSVFFSIATQESIHDENIRKSRTVIDDNEDLLNMVKTCILPKISRDHEINLKLSRDYVTFIKYEEGGFFKRHIDFEKFKINDSIEMHLIFCINAPEEGGELVVGQVPYRMIENRAILFDKLVPHEALTVMRGEKLIMTIDVLVTPQKSYLDRMTIGKDIIITYHAKEFENMLNELDPEKFSPFVCVISQIREDLYGYGYYDIHQNAAGSGYCGQQIIARGEGDEETKDIYVDMYIEKNRKGDLEHKPELLLERAFGNSKEIYNVGDELSSNFYGMYCLLKKFKEKFNFYIPSRHIESILNTLHEKKPDEPSEHIGVFWHCNEDNYDKFYFYIVGGFMSNV